jgi:DNA-binding transcriptional MocR family regulator
MKFYKVPVDLTKRVGATTAIIHAYMLAKYNWFNASGQELFESAKSIAENCNCSLSSVKSSMKTLKEMNLLESKQLQGASGKKNKYKVFEYIDKASNGQILPNERSEVQPPEWLNFDHE